MKWFSLFLLFLILISGASATTIESESLVIDLEASKAQAEVKVEELTSSDFTYITSANVEDIDAKIDSKELNCKVETLALGDEVVCETDRKKNFTVKLNYQFSGQMSDGKELKTFRYSHPIYRPTKNFELRVELPEGAGVAQENADRPISPSEGKVGSDGRTIFVEWERKPQIGDTLNFEIAYEPLNSKRGYESIFMVAVLTAVLLLAVLGGYKYWKRINRDSVESLYSDLNQDQRDIIELLRENEGEMLQKDVVDSSEYSKAKISGLVSKLVEKDVIEKKKEGRSNKLTISSSYRY
ncbi:MAG: hypothetical protein BRC29_04860 [Nanohaloarchaea archaeon SW_7_43_1]|nr:MAG: hypothetical protein BRC29_04860 [Nanohaloarchaea archaeon SW_7_43_1]